MPSMAKFLPGPKVVKNKERGEYSVLFRTPVFGVRGQLRLFDADLDLEAELKEE
jgi:hypothetical protein